jgi:hypothetical protein
MAGFVKAMRNEQAAFLDTNPLANHVLNVIARRARRTPDPLNKLQIGECFVGHKGLGLSEQQYRTVKKNLTKWGLVEFKKAGRASDQGTVAILLNSNVYDINIENEEALGPNGSQCRTGTEPAGNLTEALTGTLTEEVGDELTAESKGCANSESDPNGRATEGLTGSQRKSNGRATEGQRQIKNVKNGTMEECKKTTLPAVADKDDEDYRFAEWMLSLITDHQPDFKTPNLTSWANTIRLMRERDKRSHKDMGRVWKWVRLDDFWSPNVMSADKFRKQYDRLVALTNRPTRQENKQSERERIIEERNRELGIDQPPPGQGDFINGEVTRHD